MTYLQTIQAKNKMVVWTMSQDDARDLARWMRENLPPADLAHRDADDLDAAADALDPDPDAPGIAIRVTLR